MVKRLTTHGNSLGGMRRAVPLALALLSVAVLSCNKNDMLGPAGPLGCIHYADYLHLSGGVDTPGSALDVAVAGSHAYVADGPSGLQVIDISNPASPVIVGRIDMPGEAYGVAVAGSHTYVADGSSGLQVIDISNPVSPAILGCVTTPDVASGVALAGSCVCTADRFQGLVTVPTQCAERP